MTMINLYMDVNFHWPFV